MPQTLFKYIFFLLFPLHLWASGNNILQTEISLLCNNEPLGSVLTKIENLTDVSFVYRTDVVNTAKK
ncbi:MAG: hypothetical protein IPO21_10790 [Bacteroidales bacterium]|nr:hypothetical protein [Bacteroidales bacterium]